MNTLEANVTKSFAEIAQELNGSRHSLAFSHLAQVMGSTQPSQVPPGLPGHMTAADVHLLNPQSLIVTGTVLQNFRAVYVAWEGSSPGTHDSNVRHYFLSFTFHDDIHITSLPLIGDADEAFFGFKNPFVLFASEALTKPVAQKLIQVIKTRETALNQGLTAAQKLTFPKPPTEGTNGRVGVGFGLEVGGAISVYVETQQPPQGQGNADGDKNKQIANVQKKIGPLALNAIHFEYKGTVLWAKVTGSFNRMGLSLKLLGLGVGLDFSNNLRPEFTLGGIEVAYESPGLQIGGGLYGTVSPLEFSGEVLLHAGAFSLVGMGAYQPDPDTQAPSFFAFLFLGTPIIGAPPVLVTGLAAGLGFNRALTFPDTAKLRTFPLVKSALALADPTNPNPFAGNDPMADLRVMKQYIPVKAGESWLAAGVDFTISEVISGFGMLSISFGVDFAVDLLGVAEIIQPKGKSRAEAVAAIDLAVHAHFSPTSGDVSFRADITPQSFILSQQCHLTGGFAMQAWYGSSPHAGQWVVTLGGYSPRYQKPDYYPAVKPLGLNWRLSDKTSIKGGLYFAITPAAVMIGGYLEAVWQSGPVRAWFNVHTDFLISWKPFHYDITAGIQLGTTFTVHIIFKVHVTAHVGVDLHLWGPDFSGTAHVDLSLISFTVGFGADSSPDKAMLDWDHFKEQFLPTKKTASKTITSAPAVCDIALQQGLIRGVASGVLDWVIDPEHLVLKVSSYIPAKTCQRSHLVASIAGATNLNSDFGIGPMGLASGDFRSELHISATSNTSSSNFVAEAVISSAPRAVWHKDAKLTPMGDGSLIENTLTGFIITPQRRGPTPHTLPIDSAYLLDPDFTDISFTYTSPIVSRQGVIQGSTIANSVNGTVASANRPQILTALAQFLPTPQTVTLNRFAVEDEFLTTPRICLLGDTGS